MLQRKRKLLNKYNVIKFIQVRLLEDMDHCGIVLKAGEIVKLWKNDTGILVKTIHGVSDIFDLKYIEI